MQINLNQVIKNLVNLSEGRIRTIDFYAWGPYGLFSTVLKNFVDAQQVFMKLSKDEADEIFENPEILHIQPLPRTVQIIFHQDSMNVDTLMNFIGSNKLNQAHRYSLKMTSMNKMDNFCEKIIEVCLQFFICLIFFICL